MTTLSGITWDHSRALPPLVAAAQRFEELNPGIRIRWEKRSLHEFGHMPIDVLADRYDLIVIDHPWSGFCFARDLVVDLYSLLPDERKKELSGKFVGSTFRSYDYQGRLLALPLDAATPTPSWRPDLLQKHGLQIPKTWNDLVALADAGHLAMPGFNADLFLNWSMLLVAHQANPFSTEEVIADPGPATDAMERLKRLTEPMPEWIYDTNPIRMAERMTRADEIVYCPFAYSYVNYCRPSFVDRPLRYGNLVSLEDDTPLRSILGGTGLAITRSCLSREIALDFAIYCVSGPVQDGVYLYAGGQPAHIQSWSRQVDAFNGNFFGSTRRSHEEAILRPRYDGYVPLQEIAGNHLQAYCKGEVGARNTLEKINQAYRQSLPGGRLTTL